MSSISRLRSLWPWARPGFGVVLVLSSCGGCIARDCVNFRAAQQTASGFFDATVEDGQFHPEFFCTARPSERLLDQVRNCSLADQWYRDLSMLEGETPKLNVHFTCADGAEVNFMVTDGNCPIGFRYGVNGLGVSPPLPDPPQRGESDYSRYRRNAIAFASEVRSCASQPNLRICTPESSSEVTATINASSRDEVTVEVSGSASEPGAELQRCLLQVVREGPKFLARFPVNLSYRFRCLRHPDGGADVGYVRHAGG